MLFNTSTFLVFLVLVFALYWIIAPKWQKWANAILFIASYIFYGWWDWRFLILIAFSSGSDFIIGQYLTKTENISKRKLLLGLSILHNIGILFVFKYFNFFIDSFRTLTGNELFENWSTLNIILPVGISFYSFQSLSYVIDIFRKKLKPAKSALTFFTFVSFFPQLVAGPIERASNLIPQFEMKPVFSSSGAKSGLKLMLWGLFKKMVIADQLAVLVNAVYGQPDNFTGFEILLATIAFGYQIYCDFSGYSDIAIGTARLFGIELMTNFRTPYFSTSIRSFWQRWHISLSTWFRDYIFIPLGGSKTSSLIWARNILLTFTLSGLWHGANITFILWGFAHGLLYLIEKWVSPLIHIPKKLKNTGGWIFMFLSVNVCWIFFRAENNTQLRLIFNKLTTSLSFDVKNLLEIITTNGLLNETGRMIVIAFPVFLLIEYFCTTMTFDMILIRRSRMVRWTFYYFLIMMILFLGVLNLAPQFIYFQF